jgi:acetyl-CoA synthetase
MSNERISSVLNEERRFDPPETFMTDAHVSGQRAAQALKRKGDADPEAFWAQQAQELEWIAPYKTVLQWKAPHAKWFVGGKINASVNCIDRHLTSWRRTKAALIWEGEEGEVRTLTYQQLSREVNRFSNVLLDLGVTWSASTWVWCRKR